MKKNYQSPELEKIALESDEPVTAALGVFSNIFPTVEETDLPEVKDL